MQDLDWLYVTRDERKKEMIKTNENRTDFCYLKDKSAEGGCRSYIVSVRISF